MHHCQTIHTYRTLPKYNRSMQACHIWSRPRSRFRPCVLPSAQFQTKVMIETLEKMVNKVVHKSSFDDPWASSMHCCDEVSIEIVHAVLILVILIGLVILRKLDH